LVFAAFTSALAHCAAILSHSLPLLINHACKAMVSGVSNLHIFASKLFTFSFYCIVLLTTLFISSCYWQPFPLDSPLATPWSENITTFAEALNATLMPNYSQPLPNVIRAADRCWCDFSAGGLFEPFNISRWEHVSVERLREQLERQERQEVQAVPTPTESESRTEMPRTATPTTTNGFWPQWRTRTVENETETQQETMEYRTEYMRKEYDLRRFGLGLIVDVGWS